MNVHEQYSEDLALLALGLLDGDERAAAEQHVADCDECRAELARLRGDSAMLALSVSVTAPPPRSRERLLSAIASEPRIERVPRERKVVELAPRRSAWIAAGWLAAAAALVLAVASNRRNDELEQQLATLRTHLRDEQQALATSRAELASRQAQIADIERRLADVRSTLAIFTSPAAQHVTLVSTGQKPQPQGKAIYVADRASLVFVASNLPPLEKDRAYELWLIPTDGAPLPAGVFTPDAAGNAVVLQPPLPAGTAVKAFAVTVEPSGGSSAPTTTPMLVGAAT